MFNTRIPKRAAVITAITVLAAGTAAAAAAGAVPSFGSGPRTEDVTVTTVEAETSTTTTDPGTTTTTDPGTTTTTDGSTTTTDGATTTTDVTDDSVLLYPGRDFGLCTAWTHGAPKKITNPAFSYLVDQAKADAGAAAPAADAPEAEVRAVVDSYCDKVIADKRGDDTDATSTSVDGTATTEATESSVTGAAHSSNGNGHAGNGKGHGKP